MDYPATNLAIREVTPKDARRVAVLLSQLGYPSSADDVTSRLAYWQPDPMSMILIAERNGQAVGCLSMHAIPYLERTGRWARIESLVVEESVRGSGTGRALLNTAEAAARRWGCLAIEITSARSREDAQAFYQRMGYSDVCDRSARFHKVLGLQPRDKPSDLAISLPRSRRWPTVTGRPAGRGSRGGALNPRARASRVTLGGLEQGR